MDIVNFDEITKKADSFKLTNEFFKVGHYAEILSDDAYYTLEIVEIDPLKAKVIFEASTDAYTVNLTKLKPYRQKTCPLNVEKPIGEFVVSTVKKQEIQDLSKEIEEAISIIDNFEVTASRTEPWEIVQLVRGRIYNKLSRLMMMNIASTNIDEFYTLLYRVVDLVIKFLGFMKSRTILVI